MPRILVMIFLSLPAAAQTQIDLRTQTKSVDFTAAVSTKPLKTGSVLPATCQVGDMFFNTAATPGANLYGCAAANTWSIQGNLTVNSDDALVGQRGAINFEAGAGIMTVMTDSGSEINVLLGLDTGVVETLWGEQTGSTLLCPSTSGSSSTYQCSMQPTLQEYTTGMTLHWTPDVNGAGGPTTLNVDTLGAVPVKQPDGATDPSSAQILAGQMQTIWYDGTSFRLITTSTVSNIASTTSVLKGNGSGSAVVAVPGSDYAPSTSGTAILKGNGSGGFSSAAAGTDYQAPGSYITGLTGDVTASGPGSVAASVTKVNGGSVPASATLVGTDSSGKFTSLAVTSLPATCTPGGAPSVVAYTFGGSTQVCSCTGTNTWTCGGGSSGPITNGTIGQALTSNGSGAFGTPVTLGAAATLSLGTTAGTVAAGNDSRIAGAVQSGGALGTPSSGNASNLTNFPTLNQSTTGTAAGLTSQYVDWSAASGGASIANKPALGTAAAHAATDFQAALTAYSTISGLSGYPSTFPPINSGNWAGTWQTYSPSYFQPAGTLDILRFSICITAGCGSETTINYIATMAAGTFTECAFNLAVAPSGASGVAVDVQDATGTSIFGATKLAVPTGSTSVVFQSTFANSPQTYARGNKYRAIVTQNDSGNTAQGGTVQCR